MPATKIDVLRLYRSLLRNSSKIQNYNFRNHASRKIMASFRESIAVADASAIDTAYEQGLKQLQLVERQSLISRMYPDMTSVMERR